MNRFAGYTREYFPGVGSVWLSPWVDRSLSRAFVASIGLDRRLGDGTQAQGTVALHAHLPPLHDALFQLRPPFVTAVPSASDRLAAVTPPSGRLPAKRDPARSLEDLPPDHYLEVDAEWRSRDELAERGVGNVFGAEYGLLSLDTPSLAVPELSAASTPHFAAALAAFGLEVYDEGQRVTLGWPGDMALVEYDYASDGSYAEDYRIGVSGGYFLEMHPFPQFFAALEEGSLVRVTGAVWASEGRLALATFRVPFGGLLNVPPGVVHGDNLTLGRVGVGMVQENQDVDVVLLKDRQGRPLHIRSRRLKGSVCPCGCLCTVISSATKTACPKLRSI